MTKEYFFCYSAKLKRFLTERGVRYICVGLNERSGNKFWLYEKSPQVRAALGAYDRQVVD